MSLWIRTQDKETLVECDRIAIEKINEMFGLSVTVEFSSSWDYRIKNGKNLTEDDFKDENSGMENNNGSVEPVEENNEDKTE